MEPDIALAQRAVTVVLNLSLAVLVGASAAMLWLGSARSSWARGLLPRLRTTTLAASGAAMAASSGVLWAEAASMAEVPLAEALPAVRSVIGATHYGFAWLIGAGALVVTAALCATGVSLQASPTVSAARIAAIAIFLYSRSMVSHAGAGGSLATAVLVDWAHLALVCFWMGEVVVAGLITLRRLPDMSIPSRQDCTRYVEALSRSATFALAGIFATGVAGAWRVVDGVGSLGELLVSGYGAALLAKVALVACAAALGGINRFLVMPSLLRALHQPTDASPSPGSRFARILQVEALVLVGVLAAAAVLTSTPPPPLAS